MEIFATFYDKLWGTKTEEAKPIKESETAEERTKKTVYDIVNKLMEDMEGSENDQMSEFLMALGRKREYAFPKQQAILAICFVMLKIYAYLDQLRKEGRKHEPFTIGSINFEVDADSKDISVTVKTIESNSKLSDEEAAKLYEADIMGLKAVIQTVLIRAYEKAIPENVLLYFDCLANGMKLVPEELKNNLEAIAQMEFGTGFKKN
ncbi:hypothetical protein BGX34_006864 [Mortierella sp. NVP85]|nr:hypothetical protein BGX34_006864 [Mortierella sp. NVP85]